MFTEETQYEIKFDLIKKAFTALLSYSGLLASAVKVLRSIKCLSLNNQP